MEDQEPTPALKASSTPMNRTKRLDRLREDHLSGQIAKKTREEAAMA
jgi:hypothetical protein